MFIPIPGDEGWGKSDEELYYMHEDTGVTVPSLPTWESDMGEEVGERAAICQVKILSKDSYTGFSRHMKTGCHLPVCITTTHPLLGVSKELKCPHFVSWQVFSQNFCVFCLVESRHTTSAPSTAERTQEVLRSSFSHFLFLRHRIQCWPGPLLKG